MLLSVDDTLTILQFPGRNQSRYRAPGYVVDEFNLIIECYRMLQECYISCR